MAKIMINVNMFDMYQTVYYIENDKPTKVTSIMTNNIVNFVLHDEQWSKNVDEIELDGNKHFIEKIGNDLITELQTKFSNKNVRILINGEVFN